MTTEGRLNPDFRDMLAALIACDVAFVVVGAYALAAHGVVRATGDIDIFVEPSAENAVRVVAALNAFGAPLEMHGVTSDDFRQPGAVYQIGLPPRRIDLLTTITGVSFHEAWAGRKAVEVDGLRFSVLGREALERNKGATGRAKDAADLALLDELPQGDD